MPPADVVEVRVHMEGGYYVLHVGDYGVTQARTQAEMWGMVMDFLEHHGVRDVDVEFLYPLQPDAH